MTICWIILNWHFLPWQEWYFPGCDSAASGNPSWPRGLYLRWGDKRAWGDMTPPWRSTGLTKDQHLSWLGTWRNCWEHTSDPPGWVRSPGRGYMSQWVPVMPQPGVEGCLAVRRLIGHVCKDGYGVPPAREVRTKPGSSEMSETRTQEVALYPPPLPIRELKRKGLMKGHRKWVALGGEIRLEWKSHHPCGWTEGPHLGALGNLRVERANKPI